MKDSRLRAQRSNESPSGAFKRQNGLAPARWRGLAPTSSAHDAQNADNARKNTAFPPVCKKCAKVCRAPEKRKSHEESYDSSWDFGALEGTRIPGPLIKSQMLYRLSYERIMIQYTILPNNITTSGGKKQEECANFIPMQSRWKILTGTPSLQMEPESVQSKRYLFGAERGCNCIQEPAADRAAARRRA